MFSECLLALTPAPSWLSGITGRLKTAKYPDQIGRTELRWCGKAGEGLEAGGWAKLLGLSGEMREDTEK